MEIDEIENELELLVRASMINCYNFIDEDPISYAIDTEVEKESKLSSLRKMLEYFEEVEEYERCSQIVKWIDLI